MYILIVWVTRRGGLFAGHLPGLLVVAQEPAAAVGREGRPGGNLSSLQNPFDPS